MTSPAEDGAATNLGVVLYWLPLGVGGCWLRFGGDVYEAASALLALRQQLDIYHSVLEVYASEGRFAIEMGPSIDDNWARRGVVARGPSASRGQPPCGSSATRSVAGAREHASDYAVESPLWLTDDAAVASRVLEFVHEVPTPVWGRDDLRAGEMWTCDSLTSWLLGRTDLCDSPTARRWTRTWLGRGAHRRSTRDGSPAWIRVESLDPSRLRRGRPEGDVT